MNKLKLLTLSSLALATTLIPASASTTVKIETKSTYMNVTVPTSIEFVFNEDGTNTLPTNFVITNNSPIANVSLVKARLSAGTSPWRLLPQTANTKLLAVDTKDIKFYMGTEGQKKLVSPGNTVSSVGEVTWNNGELSIASLGSKALSFDIERGAFKTAESSAKAFDLILTFEYNQ